jgi:hypothetical protein
LVIQGILITRRSKIKMRFSTILKPTKSLILIAAVGAFWGTTSLASGTVSAAAIEDCGNTKKVAKSDKEACRKEYIKCDASH